ncbi:hypothetical protein ABH944_001173 [Caballeronia udeis]|uniref:Uncharacterized protein n=1 Tax=Caballeronia udeis TaxID=1232866 RepID=A0ABW8MCJ2_9BURK
MARTCSGDWTGKGGCGIFFSVQHESGSLRRLIYATFKLNYPPDGNVLQGGAEQVPARGGAGLFRVARSRLDIRSKCACYCASQITSNLSSLVGPNVLLIATSAASRPRAINTRPIRGTLLRASKVCQVPPIKASNHAAKSIAV